VYDFIFRVCTRRFGVLGFVLKGGLVANPAFVLDVFGVLLVKKFVDLSHLLCVTKPTKTHYICQVAVGHLWAPSSSPFCQV
jgi:hypothetical protein